MSKLLAATLFGLILLVSTCNGLRLQMNLGSPQSYKSSLQRQLLNSFSVASAAFITGSVSVQAKTFFDTDVYGDKELKIATVNKIKQKLRNAILQDITVTPDLLKLAINDALGYDISSSDGGADGSIVFEMDREENKGLQKALELVQGVKQSLQRTTSVGLADICAFAGAEALETVGCGRMTVQLGRYDAKGVNKKAVVVPWQEPAAGSLMNAFATSGLTGKDVVLLLGGLGEIDRVVRETLGKGKEQDMDEDDKEFEEQPFVPTTFGARDAIYGAKMGKGDFGSTYFADLLKSKAPDTLGKILLDDPNLKSMVQKYATNKVAFVQDVQDAYLRLGLVGEAYTTRNS